MGRINTFVKEHKRDIIVGSIATATIAVGGVVLYRIIGSGGTKVLIEVADGAENFVKPEAFRMVDVSQHVRNLPPGWNPSLEKVEEAARLGIQLTEGQTFVDPFVRRVAA